MPLTTFAAAVAVAVSLMFVTVLLASGALALERDQNTFGRLVRGPVSRTTLLAEKGLFAVAGALPVTLLMLLAVAVFATVEWDRFHLWVVAVAVAAVAFAAMGTLIGALAREVQAASLLAFTLLLPVAFLALVPSGAVSPAVHDVTAGGVVRVPVRRDRGCHALRPVRERKPGRPPAASGEPWPWPTGWPPGLRSGASADRFRRSATAAKVPWISCPGMSFPATRLRRLRRTGALRGLVRETELSVGHLVYPLFVTHGTDRREPVESMPGVERLTISHLEEEAGEIAALGIPAVLLFGIPADKDTAASGAYDEEGIVQLAVRALKQAQPDLIVITDVCLCEYTSHGHCGVVRDDGEVDNDVTLELLAKTAISHAAAGADAVAPSDMMDGRVGRDPRTARQRGPQRGADPRLQREVRVRLLRPVPRGGRLGSRVRGPARVPDGSGQRARGGARGEDRRRRGSRHGDGEAGACRIST